MTELLKVKREHLPKCLGCHNYVETMKNDGIREAGKAKNHSFHKIEKTEFDCMLDLFGNTEGTEGSAGLTIAEGAMLHHYIKRIVRSNILVTHRGDGSIGKLIVNASKSSESHIVRQVFLMGPEREIKDEELRTWFDNINDTQSNRVHIIQGDPAKIEFTEKPPSTREIPFGLVYIDSTENLIPVTMLHWKHLAYEGCGDFQTTSKYAGIQAHSGYMAFRHYEKDNYVTEWVDMLCESGHADMFDRADSLVILIRIHQEISLD